MSAALLTPRAEALHDQLAAAVQHAGLSLSETVAAVDLLQSTCAARYEDAVGRASADTVAAEEEEEKDPANEWKRPG